MSKSLLEARPRPSNRVIECVADPTRRETLSLLFDRTEPVSTGELATAVTATVTGTPRADVSADDREPIHVGLVHNHLPKLDAAELVAYDADADAVATTDNPVLEDHRLQQMIAVEADDWDRVLAAIAPRRRRVALTVLEGIDGLERAELARRVIARENDTVPSAVPGAETEDAAERFHHVHLPALREAGLVDCDDGTVRYDGHPEFESEWLPLELATPRATGGR